MATWRERGYVPDSDDEFDNFVLSKASSVQNKHDKAVGDQRKVSITIPQLNKPGKGGGPVNDLKSNTVHLLENSLADGLDTVRDVLHDAQQRIASSTEDDSPLSSLPSSLASSPAASPILLAREPEPHIESLHHSDYNIVDNLKYVAHRRQLRERAPIQLHPYMLENAHYRHLMTTRGLKPVKEAKRTDGQQVNEDSQESDIFHISQASAVVSPEKAASPLQLSNNHEGGDEESQSPRRALRVQYVADDEMSDDELPDLASLLRYEEHKDRAKPTAFTSIHNTSLDSDLSTETSKHRIVANHRKYRPPKDNSEQSTLSVPPSPPASSDIERRDAAIIAHLNPQDAKPPRTPMDALPTPVLSSNHTIPKRTHIVLSSSDESTSESEATANSPIDVDRLGRKDAGLQHFTKRIKGVLPASWLKLDMKTAESKSLSRKRLGSSPSKHTIGKEKGVAQRLVRNRQNTTQRPSIPLQLSDLRDEESEPESIMTPIRNYASVNMDDDTEALMDDVLEVDDVDPMLPAQTRIGNGSTMRKKQHQIRLDDGWGISTARQKKDGPFTEVPARTVDLGQMTTRRSLHRRSKKTRRIKGVNHVPIFDAPGLTQPQAHARPPFLKVAARQAKKIGHSAGLPASRKFFDLARWEDTEDIVGALRQWEAVQAATPGSKPRKNTSSKLSSRTIAVSDKSLRKDNINPRIPSDSNIEFDSLKESTAKLLARTSTKRSADSRVSPTFNHSSTQVASAVVPEKQAVKHLKSLWTRQNRSGTGNFLSTASKSRPAQAEREIVKKLTPFRHAINMVRPQNGQHPDVPHRRASGSRSHKLDMQSQPYLIRNVPRQSKKQLPQRWQQIDAQSVSRQDHHSAPRTDTVPILPERELLDTEPIAQTHIADPTRQYELNLLRHCSALLRRTSLLTHPLRFADGVVNDHALTMVCVEYDSHAGVGQDPDIFERLATLSTSDRIIEHFENSYVEIFNIMTARIHEEEDGSEKCLSLLRCLFVEMCGKLRAGAIGISKPEIHNMIRLVNVTIDFVQKFRHWLTSNRSSISSHQQKFRPRVYNWLILHTVRVLRQAEVYTNRYTEAITLIRLLLQDSLRYFFTRDSLWQTLRRFQQRQAATAGLLVTNVGQELDGIQSILVAWHVCQAIYNSNANNEFYMIIKASAEVPTDPLEEMALFALSIALTLPITFLNTDGTPVSGRELSSKDFSGWDLMLPSFHKLVTHMKAQKHLFEDVLASHQFVADIVDFLLRLVFEFGFPATPQLANCLFNAYVLNNMLPFIDLQQELNIFENNSFLSPVINTYSTDFDKFLVCISQAIDLQASGGGSLMRSTSANAASKLRAFIYSLFPNKAQIFDARQELYAGQFLQTRDELALYLCLYRSAPVNCGPRIEQLKNQIDLVSNHFAICELALNVWHAIARHEVERESSCTVSIVQVSEWLDVIFNQLDMRADTGQVDATRLRVIALQNLNDCIRSCHFEGHARFLLRSVHSHMEGFLHRLRPDPHNELLLVVLEVVQSYVKQCGSEEKNLALVKEFQSLLINVLKTSLREDWSNVDQAVFKAIASLWSSIARTQIKCGHKSWDDYLLPESSLSIDFIANDIGEVALQHEPTRRLKNLFLVEILDLNDDTVLLEHRALVFSNWVASLLLPVQLFSMHCIHNLTTKIVKLAGKSLDLQNFFQKMKKFNCSSELSVQELADYRFMILQHVIENIHSQQGSPEADWLAGGLDTNDMRNILNLISTQMKQTWLQLKEDPVAQNDYKLLVEAIINELEIYSVQGFRIDAWFTDGLEFPRRPQNLENMFKCRFGEEGTDIAKSSVVTFRIQCIEALKFGKQALLAGEFGRIFLCTDARRARSSLTTGKMEYTINIDKQNAFMQIVFPVYVEQASGVAGAAVVKPLLQCLTFVTEHIFLRVDNVNANNMKSFIKATISNLVAVRNVLVSYNHVRGIVPALLEYATIAIDTVWTLLTSEDIEVEPELHEVYAATVLGLVVQAGSLLSPDNLPEFVFAASSFLSMPGYKQQLNFDAKEGTLREFAERDLLEGLCTVNQVQQHQTREEKQKEVEDAKYEARHLLAVVEKIPLLPDMDVIE